MEETLHFALIHLRSIKPFPALLKPLNGFTTAETQTHFVLQTLSFLVIFNEEDKGAKTSVTAAFTEGTTSAL